MVSLDFFEKRPVMDTIGFSIKFINQNFTHLFKSIIVIYLPLYFLLGVLYFIDNEWFTIVTGGWYAWLAQTIRSEIYENVQSDFPIHYIIISLLYQAVSGACISSAFYSYFILHSKKGVNFGIKELFAEMGKNIWTLMSLNAIITVVVFVAVFFFTRIIMIAALSESKYVIYIIGLGTLATIFYFFIRMIFLQILAVTEETNLIAGIERSSEFVKNNWWNIFGVVVVNVVTFSATMLFVVGLPIYIVDEYDILNRASFFKSLFLIFIILLVALIAFFATIFWKTNLFAIYGSLYEGKEHKNLYQSVNKLGIKEKEEDHEDF